MKNFGFIRGDYYEDVITITENGIAYDLTDCSARFTMRKTVPNTNVEVDTDAVISKVIAVADIINPTDGEIPLVLDITDTNVDVGFYIADVCIFIDDDPDKPMSTDAFMVEVRADITRGA